MNANSYAAAGFAVLLTGSPLHAARDFSGQPRHEPNAAQKLYDLAKTHGCEDKNGVSYFFLKTTNRDFRVRVDSYVIAAGTNNGRKFMVSMSVRAGGGYDIYAKADHSSRPLTPTSPGLMIDYEQIPHEFTFQKNGFPVIGSGMFSDVLKFVQDMPLDAKVDHEKDLRSQAVYLEHLLAYPWRYTDANDLSWKDSIGSACTVYNIEHRKGTPPNTGMPKF